MASDRFITDEQQLSTAFGADTTPAIAGGHALDSTRILLGLMTLSRRAESSQQNIATPDGVGSVISRGVLRSLLSALHFRDVATIQHCRRVAQLSVGMAQYLGWDGPQQKVLEVASLLHDIGKVGVPDNILFKPGKLSSDESELMSLHHKIGIDVLQACRVDNEVLKFIVEAHRHYHGTIGGHRRIGANISQGARILAVADAYDSLSTDKSYRDAKPHNDVMNVLLEAAGTQFDGNVIRALSRWIEKEGLPFMEGLASGQEPKAGA
ncbi:MAG: HD-GYP domain-containing protein, partial [Planctomycetaceae bacterium]